MQWADTGKQHEAVSKYYWYEIRHTHSIQERLKRKEKKEKNVLPRVILAEFCFFNGFSDLPGALPLCDQWPADGLLGLRSDVRRTINTNNMQWPLLYTSLFIIHFRLIPLELQSRSGDKLLRIWVICPQNGTAVLKWLRGYHVPSSLPIRAVHGEWAF